MDEAEYCDRLGLIYRGELIALGTPEALKTELDARGRAGGALRSARDGDGARSRSCRASRRRRCSAAGCTWWPTTATRPRPTSASCSTRRARAIERIEQIVPSLEDVFVSLIEARDRAEQPQEEVRAMKLRRVRAVARKEFLHVAPRSAQPGHGDRHPDADAGAVRLRPDARRGQRAAGRLGPERHAGRAASSSAASPARATSRCASYVDNYRDIERAIDTRRGADGAGRSRAISPSGSTPAATAPVQLIVDGSDSNTATIAIGYAEVVVADLLAGHGRRASSAPRAGRALADARWTCGRASGSTPTWSRGTTSFPA